MKILAFVIMVMTIVITFILFERLDYKFDIKIKYFSFVAKNKFIYYATLFIWVILLFCLVIKNYTANNYYIWGTTFLFFSIFISLYHPVRNWRMAYNVYIKNVNLLIKAKEKKRKEKGKKINRNVQSDKKYGITYPPRTERNSTGRALCFVWKSGDFQL